MNPFISRWRVSKKSASTFHQCVFRWKFDEWLLKWKIQHVNPSPPPKHFSLDVPPTFVSQSSIANSTISNVWISEKFKAYAFRIKALCFTFIFTVQHQHQLFLADWQKLRLKSLLLKNAVALNSENMLKKVLSKMLVMRERWYLKNCV